MDKLWNITKMILKRMFKKPTGILLHLIVPIVLSVGLFLLISMNTGYNIGVGYVDLDQSQTSNTIIERLEATSGIDLYEYDEMAIEDAVVRKEVVSAIIIDQGLEEALLGGDQMMVNILSLSESTNADWLRQIVSSEYNNMVKLSNAAENRTENYYDLLNERNQGYIVSARAIADTSVEKDAIIQTLGIYLLFLMITTFLVAFRILDEKEIGTYARIGMSAVHPKIYTLANIFAGFIVAGVQIALVLIGLQMLGINFYTSAFNIFIVLMFMATCSISLAVLIAAYSKSMKEAGVTIGMIISPSCMLAGCLWPLKFVPEFMRRIAYLMPQRWALDAIIDLQRNKTFVDILPNLLIVSGFTLLFFLITVYRIKNEDKTIA